MTREEEMNKITKGEEYTLRIQDQLATGKFIREVKLWGFLKRYEFSVRVHIRNFDYGQEYYEYRVFKVKKEDIIK